MILDKLLEKKDVLAYIEFRIKFLQNQGITKYPEADRGFISERFRGRILELSKLKDVINRDVVKERGKMYWQKVAEEEDQHG